MIDSQHLDAVIPYEEEYRAFLGDSVKLSSDRKQLTANCPFHADTTRSLSVELTTGKFTCHSCGATGNYMWGEELDRQLTEKLTAYREAQTEADSADKTELEKARQDIRPTKEYAAVKKLSKTYGYCEQDRFDRSRKEAAEQLGENPPEPFKAPKVPNSSAKEKQSKNNQERQL